jgi:pyruvate dehydrogenase E2 component (dihydrolipoyllysine-residue acetyltransferase)
MTEQSGIKGAVEVTEPTRLERTVARRAAESRATVPDLTLSAEVDMTAALALITERSASVTAALVRAAALALREHPRANGSYRDGRFELYSRVNAGVVLPSSEAATVLDADQKPVEQLAAEIDDLERRSVELTSPELSGATFTIAQYGVTWAEALITPPHAVALAAGEVREVALVRDGAVAAAPAIALALACDHRIVYGELAAAVLGRIKERLERAEL